MIRKYFLGFILLLIILPPYLIDAQTTGLHPKIELNAGTYSLGELLNRISTLPGYYSSYNGHELPMDAKIKVNVSNPDLTSLIGYIENQCPVEIILKDNYLIVRKKAILKKFTISGTVTDDKTGETMVGVNIYLKDSTQGVITDPSGRYRMTLPKGNYILVFSYFGYTTQHINISLNSDRVLDIHMKTGTIQLNEVKIVGERQFFGNLNQGRTIESIDAKEVEATKTNNVSDVLQAKMPGVWVTKVSGAPGDHNEIRIRGINSLFGSVDPLYVVDGVSVPIVNLHTLGIADLNIHDVENITVLKDASSNAIYGFQGGNGVIIIDTKRGGKNEINFSTTVGFQQLPRRYPLMNATDFLNSLYQEKQLNISQIRDYYPPESDTLCADNWQNNLFTTGMINEYALSGGGTKGKVNYYLSGDYYKHEGIVRRTGYTKYSFSASVGRNFFNRLSVEALYKGSLQQNKNNLDSYWGNRVIYEYINKSPVYNCTPLYDYMDTVLGTEYVRTNINYPELHTHENPDSLLNNTNKSLNILANSFSGFASLRILNNLQLNYSAAYSIRHHDYKTKVLAYNYDPSFNNYLVSHENYALANNQLNLTYKNSLGLNNINFVTIGKFYRDMVEWTIDSLAAQFDKLTDLENLYTRGNLAIQGESGRVVRHINSWMAHLNYDYSKKYFLSLAANYENLKEGTSRNLTKLFPSIAVTWDLAKEYGLNHIRQLDHFNVFFNWGISGNYPLNGLSRDIYAQKRYLYPDTVYVGYSVDQLANHKLEPEIIQGYNLGTEISFFKKRLNLQANYYVKANKNLILQRDIPYYYGGGRIYINIAEMGIHGFEFKLEGTPILNSDWQWYSRFNFSTFREQVNKLDGQDKYFYNDNILIPDFVIREKAPLGNFLGYKYLGKVKRGTVQSDYPNVVFSNGGMYENVDTITNQLNLTDKVVIGNILPKYTWNWYNSFDYKHFSLEAVWYAVIGVDKFNATRAMTFITGLNSDINAFIADTNKAITGSAFYQSSAFVENASFVRLKSLSLSYTTEKLFTDKIKVKFTLGADNLITLTHYKGYDPEATIYTDNVFSDNAVDLGAYPNPRSYYLSIDMTFK